MLIVSQRTFSGGHQEDATEHNKIPEIDTKEEPQFSGCSAEYMAHEQHHRSQQKQWMSPFVDGAWKIACRLPQIVEQEKKNVQNAFKSQYDFIPVKLISSDANIHLMV